MKVIFTEVNRNMLDVTRNDEPKPEARTLLGSMLRLRKRWVFWANSNQTQLHASELRAIARRLDKLNKGWDNNRA